MDVVNDLDDAESQPANVYGYEEDAIDALDQLQLSSKNDAKPGNTEKQRSVTREKK